MNLAEKMTSRMNVLLTFVRHRNKFRHQPKSWRPDAVRYGLVKYYPKKKDAADPEITPSKILMVHRVKPFKGNPWWEKQTLTQIGFEEKGGEPVFVKNTPEMCALLWTVKHLVKISPLKVPKEVPELNELTQSFFHENGTFHVLGQLDPARYEATLKAKNSSKQLKYATISEKLRLQWIKGTLI